MYSSFFKPRMITTFTVSERCTGGGGGAVASLGGGGGSFGGGGGGGGVLLRSLSVMRRFASEWASLGWRKINESLPIFVASKTFCASSAVTSSVTALARTVALSGC